MSQPYKPSIPKDVGEIRDVLGWMMLSSPTFIDKSGYFPEMNIDTVFYELNEGLRLMRVKLGEERYIKLIEMSGRMRAHFEADPENKTDDTLKGRDLIVEMRDSLKQNVR
jgi:hypothetical protein